MKTSKPKRKGESDKHSTERKGLREFIKEEKQRDKNGRHENTSRAMNGTRGQR